MAAAQGRRASGGAASPSRSAAARALADTADVAGGCPHGCVGNAVELEQLRHGTAPDDARLPHPERAPLTSADASVRVPVRSTMTISNSPAGVEIRCPPTSSRSTTPSSGTRTSSRTPPGSRFPGWTRSSTRRPTRRDQLPRHGSPARPQGAHHRRGLGIGAAVAIAFAREGADVALSYLPEAQVDAEAIPERVRAADRKVVLLRDVRIASAAAPWSATRWRAWAGSTSW